MIEPAKDDSLHSKLDILIHSMMESRAESKFHRRSIMRTQWFICVVIVVAILIAAIFW